MDYGIFNVRTNVNASDCTGECTDTVRESALKVNPGRKIPCHREESNLRLQRAGPMLYQLSYIPTPLLLSPETSAKPTDKEKLKVVKSILVTLFPNQAVRKPRHEELTLTSRHRCHHT